MQPNSSSSRMVLIAVSCLLFLTMCRSYEAEPIDYDNSLVCQAYTDYFKDGSSVEKSNECWFTCPDGVFLIVDESRISEPKADLRGTFCSLDPTPTASTIPSTITPTSSTPQSPTETPRVTLTPLQPLLSEITTCNEYASFVSFRFVEPVPDLQGKNLAVTIDDRAVECGVDPAFPSILTCGLPPFMNLPTMVLVTLNDAPTILPGETCNLTEPEATGIPATQNPTEPPLATPTG